MVTSYRDFTGSNFRIATAKFELIVHSLRVGYAFVGRARCVMVQRTFARPASVVIELGGSIAGRATIG